VGVIPSTSASQAASSCWAASLVRVFRLRSLGSDRKIAHQRPRAAGRLCGPESDRRDRCAEGAALRLAFWNKTQIAHATVRIGICVAVRSQPTNRPPSTGSHPYVTIANPTHNAGVDKSKVTPSRGRLLGPTHTITRNPVAVPLSTPQQSPSLKSGPYAASSAGALTDH
jgi:hypothetical protein